MFATKKKILFFLGGTYVSGAEILMLEIMRLLRERGHEVRCTVSGWNNGDCIRRLERMGIEHDSVKLGFIFVTKPTWTLKTLFYVPKTFAQLMSIVRDFQPDVVYHQGYRTLLMGFYVAPARRTIVHVMEPEPNTPRTRLRYAAVRSLANHFLAPSQFIKRELVARGIPEHSIHVAYPPAMLRGSTVARVRAASDRLRVGIIGQVIPRKGHIELFDAMSRLRDAGHAFELHVYGEGADDWTQQLKTAARSFGIEECTTWHGFVGDQASIYEALDIVVVPTRGETEAFGMVAAEPALWSVPVVASDTGGLREVIVDGETGLSFRDGDVDHLTEKLSLLFENPELRKKLGANANEFVRRTFSPEAALRVIETVLELATDESRSHA